MGLPSALPIATSWEPGASVPWVFDLSWVSTACRALDRMNSESVIPRECAASASLSRSFGFPQPDLAARQRIGPSVDLHPPGAARQLLYVSGDLLPMT